MKEASREARAKFDKSLMDMSSVSTRLGKKTIELNNITKAYDGHTYINDFSYIFLRDDRIGIIGSNGCGKSTLMKIITGQIQPDSGSVEIGDTVHIGYFMQENEPLDENQTVLEFVRSIGEYVQTVDGKATASQMCEKFLFSPKQQWTPIRKLSGGEKRRLYLLSVLMSAPNVLILDEPTNDLDIETLEVLEDYLDGFAGIIITVSHDRYFLDRTVDRIFAFEAGVTLPSMKEAIQTTKKNAFLLYIMCQEMEYLKVQHYQVMVWYQAAVWQQEVTMINQQMVHRRLQRVIRHLQVRNIINQEVSALSLLTRNRKNMRVLMMI